MSASQAGANYAVSVNATPPSIPADGRSYSQVIIMVTDQTGAPVPDGTEVRLTTTAGEITAAAYTSGGRAAGILTSCVSPQIAMINATVAGSSGVTQVEFLSADDTPAEGSKTIRVSGGQVVYSVERDTLMASDNVTIEYRGLTITALCAQVCQTTRTIRAQGEVTVKQGERTLKADVLVCNIRSDQILLRDAQTNQVQALDVARLKSVLISAPAGDFTPLDSTGSKTWIACRRAIVVPGEKALFFGASIYVGESKVIRMPYYSYSYENRQSILQQVQFTSNDGLLVDLPLYYRMQDTSVGAMKVRYAGKGNAYGGYFKPRKGLSFGLDQAYSVNDSNQGRAFIDAIASPSRTFELVHHLDFGPRAGNARADLSLHFQPSSSFAKNVYNSSLNVSGSLHSYDYSISGYFSGSRVSQCSPLDPTSVNYADQSDCSIRATLRPRSPLLNRGGIRVSPSLSVAYGSPGLTSTGRAPSCLYQSFDLAYSYTPISARSRGLNFTGSSSFIATEHGQTGLILRAGPNMRTNWRGGSATLGYTLNAQAGPVGSLGSVSKHSLNGMLTLYSGGKWNATTFGSYGIDRGQLVLNSQASYSLPNRWQVRTNFNLYRYAYNFSGHSQVFATSYRKAGLYHPLGPYEIGLALSPDGQEYGVKNGRHLWLEFGAAGF